MVGQQNSLAAKKDGLLLQCCTCIHAKQITSLRSVTKVLGHFTCLLPGRIGIHLPLLTHKFTMLSLSI